MGLETEIQKLIAACASACLAMADWVPLAFDAEAITQQLERVIRALVILLQGRDLGHRSERSAHCGVPVGRGDFLVTGGAGRIADVANRRVYVQKRALICQLRAQSFGRRNGPS